MKGKFIFRLSGEKRRGSSLGTSDLLLEGGRFVRTDGDLWMASFLSAIENPELHN